MPGHHRLPRGLSANEIAVAAVDPDPDDREGEALVRLPRADWPCGDTTVAAALAD
jgi:hypothetical protein